MSYFCEQNYLSGQVQISIYQIYLIDLFDTFDFFDRSRFDLFVKIDNLQKLCPQSLVKCLF